MSTFSTLKKCLLYVSLLAQSRLIKSESTTTTTTSVPSACNFLEDGYHFIQPIDNSIINDLTKDNDLFEERTQAPPIYVYCNNGFTILNVDLDPNIKQYFSTFHDYLKSSAAPDLNDHTSWEMWYLPSSYSVSQNEDNKYGDHPFSWSVTESDCTKCLSEDELDYGYETAYYMTPDIASCNWPTKDVCDFDSETLECYTCEARGVSSTELPGKCGHVQYSVDSFTTDEHSTCTEGSVSTRYELFMPSIITIGSYCVCYKPNDELVLNYDVDTSYYESIVADHNTFVEETEEEEIKEESNINNIDTNIQYLSAEDFEDGTYRITESGTYILTEDVIFNPHSLSYEDIYEKGISPNAENAWLPYPEQSEDYPGAGEYDGWYWLGFFAMFTIEASNVVLDLNGHTISMHEHFYYQQRYFISIQISNKPFGDSAGPTWTGVGQITGLNNIEIKNGVIGLSSHIGIHAIECSDIYLSDLVIKDFETHGVVFNGFSNVELNNIEIGPSVLSQLPVTGNYNLARLSFQVFRDAVDEIGDKEIKFYQRRPTTYRKLYEILSTELDLVFKYIAYNDDSVTSHQYWQEAKSLFISDLGVSRAGTLYGAVFRSKDAEVFSFGKNLGDMSDTLKLNNVYIHDLELSTQEVVTSGNPSARQMLNAPIPFMAASSNLFSDLNQATYVGNTWVDILLALHSLSDNWWHLNRFGCDSSVCDGWTTDGHPMTSLSCGWDSLGHCSKGTIGIKMEYVVGVEMNNVEIANVHSISELGTSVCGEWTDGSDGGPTLQESSSNTGYGATFAFGIVSYVCQGKLDNVNIHDVASYFGPSYGHYAMVGNNLTVSNSKVYNIFGGLMNEEDYSEDHLPNRANRACAIDLNLVDNEKFYEYHGEEFPLSYNDVILTNVEQYCLIGHTGCQNTDGATYSATTDNDHEIDATTCSDTTLSFSDGTTIAVNGQQITKKKAKLTFYMQDRLKKQLLQKSQTSSILYTVFIVTLGISLSLIIFYYIRKLRSNKHIDATAAATTQPNEYQPLIKH